MIRGSSAFIAIVILGGSGALEAQDFLRGDFTSDERVSVADGYWITSFLFRGVFPGPCLNAGDANDDGKLNLTDAIRVLIHLFLDGAAPPSPFPQLGPDPTENDDAWVDCGSYGGGSVVDDPAARLEILDAIAPGGEDGKATITVRLTTATTIAGYSGRILVDTGVVGSVENNLATDLTGTGDRTAFNGAKVSHGKLNFGFLCTLVGIGEPWMPPRADSDVLAITVCLKDGTAAGEYPLTLAAGELVEAATGISIQPPLVSGTLTVLEQVAEGAGCPGGGSSCADTGLPPGDPLADLHALFEVRGATTTPGGTVELPFVMRADAEIQGYAFSIDFDETILHAESIIKVFDKAPGTAGFEKLEYNNANNHAGSAGIDEGFFVGAMVFSFLDNCHNMPANRDNVALKLRLLVDPDTTAETTEVAFLDGGKGSGQPVRNALTAFGTMVVPELASSFVFLDAVLGIQPDITVFLRGDSNNDQKLDIADPIHTLGFLFLGSERPACFDAADADDSGAIDISDATRILMALFTGESKTLPAPFPAPGEDPTADAMTCSLRG